MSPAPTTTARDHHDRTPAPRRLDRRPFFIGRGSTVRVRPRALQKPRKSRLFLLRGTCKNSSMRWDGPVYGAFRSGKTGSSVPPSPPRPCDGTSPEPETSGEHVGILARRDGDPALVATVLGDERLHLCESIAGVARHESVGTFWLPRKSQPITNADKGDGRSDDPEEHLLVERRCPGSTRSALSAHAPVRSQRFGHGVPSRRVGYRSSVAPRIGPRLMNLHQGGRRGTRPRRDATISSYYGNRPGESRSPGGFARS